jgi:cobalamin biosynthesis protein CobW
MRVRAIIETTLPRAVKTVTAANGKLDLAVLLGLAAAAEDDLAARPSHHDAEDGAHEHDDFTSFGILVPELHEPTALLERLAAAAAAHDILRIKGFVAVRGKPMKLEIQGVGARFRQNFSAPWAAAETRQGHLVVIGQTGMDEAAIRALVAG